MQCESLEEFECGNKQYNSVYDELDKNCGKSCPPECNSVDYVQSTSVSDYPSVGYAEYVRRNTFVGNKYPNLSAPEIQSNMLVLNVFYSDLKYTEIGQLAQYTVIDIISNIGGTLGNYLFNLLFFITGIFFD